ncbi:type II secretion system F family protein [Candidatus Peregrinibacteria bacterium]|jgi:type IV pilus assembly protein PilC|nr:type II secretion system F family protein [Candidatus Peregrinibacteria bacterium]MBT7736355.1 type II secretion system F family protein [Candidatus Peregrinibacteria bacterium]
MSEKDFATTGSESYELKKPNQEQGDHVVLNIQDDESEGVILDDRHKGKIHPTGGFKGIYESVNRFLLQNTKIKIKDKSTFFHLLSVMVNSGIPMIKSLSSLGVQMEKVPRLQMIIEKISVDVSSGASLSEALSMNPDVFSEAEVGMIQSGEASGQLSSVLENLATDLEKEYSIRSKVKSAMIYPVVVILLLFAVVTAMMIFVIPQLKSLFESNAGVELPMITKIVVSLSDFMVEKKRIMGVSVLGIALFFVMFKKTEIGRYLFDKFKINVPIFGELFRKSYLSHFARSLSNLLSSGLSVIRTLEVTANSVGNEVYRRRLLLSSEDVKQGIPIAESLSESPLFPPMLINMLEVGESTAQVDEIAAKIAKFYEDEVDTAVAGISKIIEPVILIVIGLAVSAVVAAIMLPIMRLTDLAGVI